MSREDPFDLKEAGGNHGEKWCIVSGNPADRIGRPVKVFRCENRFHEMVEVSGLLTDVS